MKLHIAKEGKPRIKNPLFRYQFSLMLVLSMIRSSRTFLCTSKNIARQPAARCISSACGFLQSNTGFSFTRDASVRPVSPAQLHTISTPSFVPTRSLGSTTNGNNGETAYGKGMDQNDMMETDMLVVVDKNDMPITSIPTNSFSKKRAHMFSHETPRGIVHRAFSVFLFNERNELLLTRRADSKITFPGVWTNTCCSHPLHGMTPSEVDNDFPTFPGIKHAARRKLYHELGIRSKYVPHENFNFLSRFHYWAADTVTYGPEAPWGEHEIDYVLFIKCEGEGPPVEADPEEVSEYKYVTPDELRDMMYNKDNGLLWSPWFIGIMERGGFQWWEDLEEALKPGSKYCNEDITYFDPPEEHKGVYNAEEHGRDTGVLSNEDAAVLN
uniref:isopentenyl-diphosphate Delta-isomerase n=1 Tax=Ditylum brightwellii TaxID=49249 RepID=A0A6V2P6Y6_9STRA|mmetsp:Transcript_15491/g.22950  ORF Transcript_15491/g.22950 Transcript_15491/m.22950 type:complete len:383 (-) Transcript_15491:89-1237(-)